MTQWYPRMCKYGDEMVGKTTSSQVLVSLHLSFGNFKVQMTVPADHIVGATGECQNYAACIKSNTNGSLDKKHKLQMNQCKS